MTTIVCCKCRPVLFVIRTRKAHEQLECYCESHAPRHVVRGQSNVREFSEDEFRRLAGRPHV